MSARVMNLGVKESQTSKLTENENGVESVKCDCCGLTEECTAAYINRIRERYEGKWICGLCAEAVKDEVIRGERLITTDEALNKHIAFTRSFSSSVDLPPNPVVDLISAMRQILRRSLDSPRSMPCSPTRRVMNHRDLTRSGSCIPALSLAEDSDCLSCPSADDVADDDVDDDVAE